MKVSKTIRMPTEPIDPAVFAEMDRLWMSFGMCRQLFLKRFGGIRSMVLVRSFTKTRNLIREEQKHIDREAGGKPLEEIFHFQNRHWVMALAEACSNICSMWTNTGSRCKADIRENKNLSDEERAYCLYVFSAPAQWQKILLRQDPLEKASGTFRGLSAAVKPDRIHALHNLVRRQTRKRKPGSMEVKSFRCISLDQEMYRIHDSHGAPLLEFASGVPGKRFTARLKGPFCYAKRGNIQLVLDRGHKTLSIHKCIQAGVKEKRGKGPVGGDKGYHTLLSCSDKREYGTGFGLMLTKESARLNDYNTSRNHLIQKKKTLEGEIRRLLEQARRSAGGAGEAGRLAAEARRLQKTLSNIERCNIGNGKYGRRHHRAKEAMVSAMNHEIRNMVETSAPSEFVKEDLSWSRDGGKKGRSFNRAMNMWLRGILDERLEYILSAYGIPFETVNPAYTSQYCSVCGEPVERSGAHHEIATCPVCGRMDANVNAAVNILARKADPEITRYTPYKKVKEILEGRRRKQTAA